MKRDLRLRPPRCTMLRRPERARPLTALLAFASAFGLALLLSAPLACRAAAPPPVLDDSHESVVLAHTARRIITLSPHAAELVFAAGGGERIIGTVSYSDYPPAAASIPRIGDSSTLDLERILALKPDLIVAWRHGSRERQLQQLKDMGLTLFHSEPRQLDDIPASLEKLGRLLGTQATADAAAERFRGKIAALRQAYARRSPVSVFYQVWDTPLMTFGADRLMSELIGLCGGRNVFADLTPIVPTVSVEAVIAANPQAIVTAAMGATRSAHLPGLERWRRWPTLSAVAHDNLFAIDGDLINRPGPRLADGAALLCGDLELARERLKSVPATSAAHVPVRD